MATSKNKAKDLFWNAINLAQRNDDNLYIPFDSIHVARTGKDDTIRYLINGKFEYNNNQKFSNFALVGLTEAELKNVQVLTNILMRTINNQIELGKIDPEEKDNTLKINALKAMMEDPVCKKYIDALLEEKWQDGYDEGYGVAQARWDL